MNPIDYIIMVVPVVIAMGVGLACRKYVRSVADFMAGGRAAGRYLLCTAKAEQGAGAVMFVALFQVFNQSGFVTNWWQQISIPLTLIISITGFVVYRYRQTRALTLAQFFEMRYSRNIRLFTGVLGFLAGLLNFGIIPIIGSRFFVYFLGLPTSFDLLGVTVPTYLALMACTLTASATMITVGGQVTVLVTNCLEGIFSQIGFAIIAIALVMTFDRSKIAATISVRPPGHSLINPFDSFQTSDFNLWWVLMTVSFYAYGTMAWQNSHAFNSSAATPHDSRMGYILTTWRQFTITLVITLLAVCATTFMYENTAPGAVAAHEAIGKISDPATLKQMWTPIALSYLLPVGIKGILCAIILMGVISGDAIHLHSWSTIFLQDVVVPLQKKAMSPERHLLLLRLGVVGVALFAFLFGTLYRQTDYIVMWWQVTTAIYVGGAGAVIIGGLYWSRGTTEGAWAGLITGSLLATGGILLRHIYPDFGLNGTQISFFAALIAITTYVAVSLMTCREPHNMDRLLHRGAYAVEKESPTEGMPDKSLPWLARLAGIDHDFSRSDRWVTYAVFYFSVLSFVVVVIGTGLYFFWRPWSDLVWVDYWTVTAIWIPLAITIGTTIWFTIGCSSDLKLFLQRLKAEHIDPTDDGRVEDKSAH